MTPDHAEEILTEFRRVRSPFKVAKNLGFDIETVWDVIDATPDALANHVERYGGEGRPDLRPFIVAKIKSDQRWDNDDPPIAAARAAYEAGTHDMQQHRDGSWKFLLSVPNRRVVPRPDYFKPEMI